jgi:glycosyltransferase involved in cell wall biosynthesis
MMKIIHILPELEEGGVERHVLMLSGQQRREGHVVYVASAGGKLVSQLDKGVLHIRFPVHSKNPLVAVYCAVRLASFIRKNAIDIIHAHSRVPAWIAMFATEFSGKPFIVTAHAYFSTQTKWLYTPYRRAKKVICVSRSVQSGMENCFAENTVVIRNGMPPANISWKNPGGSIVNFLFIGRLTQLKGLQDILKILPDVTGDWRLDVVGDGPFRGELEKIVTSLSLKEKVIFRGFRDDPDTWMAKSDCLLFPSYIEGMPLTLARAIQIGMPVIASDIEPVREMSSGRNGLVKPGDLVSWKRALETFLDIKVSPADFDRNMIPSVLEMTRKVQSVYQSATSPEDRLH